MSKVIFFSGYLPDMDISLCFFQDLHIDTFLSSWYGLQNPVTTGDIRMVCCAVNWSVLSITSFVITSIFVIVPPIYLSPIWSPQKMSKYFFPQSHWFSVFCSALLFSTKSCISELNTNSPTADSNCFIFNILCSILTMWVCTCHGG